MSNFLTQLRRLWGLRCTQAMCPTVTERDSYSIYIRCTDCGLILDRVHSNHAYVEEKPSESRRVQERMCA